MINKMMITHATFCTHSFAWKDCIAIVAGLTIGPVWALLATFFTCYRIVTYDKSYVDIGIHHMKIQ